MTTGCSALSPRLTAVTVIVMPVPDDVIGVELVAFGDNGVAQVGNVIRHG